MATLATQRYTTTGRKNEDLANMNRDITHEGVDLMYVKLLINQVI